MILVIDTINGVPYNAIAYADKNEHKAERYIDTMERKYTRPNSPFKLYKLKCPGLVFPK